MISRHLSLTYDKHVTEDFLKRNNNFTIKVSFSRKCFDIIVDIFIFYDNSGSHRQIIHKIQKKFHKPNLVQNTNF